MIQAVKRLRLFLEGIECPVISASVTSNIGGPATASISVIATPELLNISVRTCVHLFFLEDIAVSLDSDYRENLDLASDKRYRLLYMGEVHSISYTKNASGGINGLLECKDHFENYNRAYVYYASSSSLNANATDASNSQYIYAGALVKSNYIPFNAEEVLKSALTNPKPLTSGFQTTKGLLAGIIHILERYSGFIDQNNTVQIAGYSMFQTIQQLRLRILQQIGVYSNDTFAAKLVSSSFLLKFITNRFSIDGGLMTLVQVLDHILKVIYYTRVSNSCAYGHEIDDIASLDNVSRSEVAEYLRTITTDEAFIRPPTTYDVVQDKANYPIEWFGLSDQSYQRVKGSKDIRVWKEWVNKPLSTPNASSQNALIILINKLSLNASDKEVQVRLEQLNELLQTIYDRTEIYSKVLSNFFTPGSVVSRMYQEVPPDANSLQGPIQGGKLVKTTLMLPELFWSVAPTCNIIFPNMYETFSVTSQLTEQTTRLTLQSTNELINTPGANRVYFAPSIVPVQELTDDGVINNAEVKEFLSRVERGKRFDGYLLDHELFSGIVPEFATKDIFKFIGTGEEPFKDIENFLTRTTDYLYTQSRLSKTTISMGGIFNPYVAVGFPCVIFDRYSTTDTGSDVLGTVSNHYIGLVSLVTHSIDQSSANTSYSVSYVRRHKDETIKLGSGLDTVTKVDLGNNNFGTNLQTPEPLESRIEPLWLDAAYRSDKIGENVYKELLGVNSIVDDPSLEKPFSKVSDGSSYASQESAIENLEKKILSTKMSSNGSIGKFTRSYIYREIASLDFVFGDNSFHSFDIDIEALRQTFNTCSPGLTPPINNTPHTGDLPKGSGANIEEVRKELVRKYVESIHNRGIPL